MRTTYLLAALGLAVFAFAAGFLVGRGTALRSQDRYQVVTGFPVPGRLDRLTGKMELPTGEGWKEVK